jgi:hypothetical protein
MDILKIICTLFFAILLVGTVSAFEFDNIGRYNETERVFTIRNSILGIPFLQLDIVAEIELNTPTDLKVFAGSNRKVAEFTISSYENYVRAFKEMEFYDVKKDMEKFEREFTYKYKKSLGLFDVNDYEWICIAEKQLINGTIPQNCENKLIGTHKEERFEWIEFDTSKELLIGEVTIGIFTDVQKGDYVEWITTLFGVRIDEWASWTANFNVDLDYYYNFEDTSTKLIDVISGNNGTKINTPANVSGLIGSGNYFFETDVDLYNITNPVHTGNGTFSFWFKVNNTAEHSKIFGKYEEAGTFWCAIETGGLLCAIHTPLQKTLKSNFSYHLANNTWHNVVILSGIGGAKIWVDNVIGATDITTQFLDFPYLVLGARITSTSGIEAGTFNMDEIGVWSRRLTETEISDLYNGGLGLTYVKNPSPTVTLNSPVNTYNTTTPTIDFNCTVSDNGGITNVSLLINGTIKQTNSSGINNVDYIFTETLTTGAGFYNWTCLAFDDENASNIASARNFTYLNDLAVSLISPVNAYNTTTPTITFNGTASDDTAVINVSLYIDGVLNETNSSGLNNTFYLFTKSLSEGNHNWTYETCDIFACVSATVRTLFIDSIVPSIIISAPIGAIDYHIPYENLTVNWTILDINLDTCWYNYNNTNVTVSCVANTTEIIVFDKDDRIVTFYANDTYGNFNTNYTNWTYNIWEYNHTFNEIVLETNIENFELNITMPSGATIQNADFWYNNTSYSASIVLSGNDALLSYELLTPSVEVDTNMTFFWEIELDTGTVNTTDSIQTVLALNIDDCSVNEILILNYTLEDEGTQALITGVNLSSNIEVEVTLYTITDVEIIKHFETYINTSYASVCLNKLLNGTEYKIDVVATYVADGYVQEFWYIDNGNLTPDSWSLNDYTIKNITIRDLSIDDSTTFLFKYYDVNYQIREGAIVTVLRKYIGEGAFKEVERCRLDSNGDCHLHLVEEDVIYQFRVTDGGELEYLSGEYNAKCQGVPCQITLSKTVSAEEWDEELNNLEEGTYSLTTDTENRTITLDFNLEETGIIKLEVYEYDQNADIDVLITEDTTTAKIGSVGVFVPLSYENQTYYAVIRHNDGFVSSTWVDMSESGYKYFGALGLFLGALLVLTLGLIAVSSGEWTVVFIILGLLIASITKLIDMDFYLIMWIVSAGGLIIWKLATRRSI